MSDTPNSKFTLQSSLYLKDPKNLPVYIYRATHHTDDLPPVHDHEFYELVYIIHGHATHNFENKYYPLHSGDLILIQPGQSHTYVLEGDSAFEIISCLFLPNVFVQGWQQAIDPQNQIESFLLHPFLKRKDEFHPRISLALTDARRIRKLLEEMMDEQVQNREFVQTVIRLKVFELLHLMIRLQDEALQKDNPSHTMPHDLRTITIRRIHHFMKENSEQKDCIKQLSTLLNFSLRHLNRLFKQDTGMTIMEMLHLIRIERAKQLLIHTDDRVVDIASRVGYEDTSFFTKLFIRKVKCSPGRYREEIQAQKK